jgi:hypothetical protein
VQGSIAFGSSLRVSLGDDPISLKGHEVRAAMEALEEGHDPIFL